MGKSQFFDVNHSEVLLKIDPVSGYIARLGDTSFRDNRKRIPIPTVVDDILLNLRHSYGLLLAVLHYIIAI